jgi:hypothetical protein
LAQNWKVSPCACVIGIPGLLHSRELLLEAAN